ncbi:hypothetical protein OROMI_028207 [Orobanche minor]
MSFIMSIYFRDTPFFAKAHQSTSLGTLSYAFSKYISSAEFFALYSGAECLYIHHFGNGRELAQSSMEDNISVAHQLFHFPPVPFRLEGYSDHEISFAGTCDGLICLYGKHGSRIFKICVWNPSIGRSVSLPLPESITPGLRRWVFGFGRGSNVGEYKVVSIIYKLQRRGGSGHFPIAAHLYQYPDGGGWRSIVALAIQDVILCYSSWLLLDKSICHWLGCSRVDGCNHIVVVSFDMRSEVFDIISLPHASLLEDDDIDFSPDNTLVYVSAMIPSRFQLLPMPYNGTLLSVCALNVTFDIWVCDGGTWRLQFKIDVPQDMFFPGMLGPRCIRRGYNKVFGFLGNGDVLVGGTTGLRSIDPASGDVTNLFGYRGLWLSRLLVLNYTESLALIPRMEKWINPKGRNTVGAFPWLFVACGCLLMFGGAWRALISQRR